MKLKKIIENIENRASILNTAFYKLKKNHPRTSYYDFFINLIKSLESGQIQEIERSKFSVKIGKQWGLEFIDNLVKDGLFIIFKKGNKQFIKKRIESEIESKIELNDDDIKNAINNVKNITSISVLNDLNLRNSKEYYGVIKRSSIYWEKEIYTANNEYLIKNLKLILILKKLYPDLIIKNRNSNYDYETWISEGDHEIEKTIIKIIPIKMDFFINNKDIGGFFYSTGGEIHIMVINEYKKILERIKQYYRT